LVVRVSTFNAKIIKFGPKKRIIGLAGIATAGLIVALPAAAQPAPPPLAAQPVPPPGSPLPSVVPRTPPAVGAPTAPAAPVAPAPVSPAIVVPISSVSVEGATAYPPGVLEALAAGLTGDGVPAQKIEAARAAMLNRYRADGYVYTTVNARIRAGALHFIVTEGRIVDVKLEGDIGPAGTQVLRFLSHLTEIRPINTQALERWLLLAGDIPGVQITSTLNPSTEDPGALTLVASVHRQKFSGQISADNRAFRQTGPEELLTQFDANSFTSFGERTEVSLYHTFNNTETFGQVSEEFFIGGSGLKLKIYGGAGETVPSGTLGAIGYDGVTRVGGLQLSYPLIRSRQQTLNLVGAFDVIESEILTNTGSGGHAARASFDSLRVLRAGADYSVYDVWLGPAFAASSDASFRLSQGLPWLGASPNGDHDAPRLHERVDYTKVSAEADRTQALFSPFPAAGVSLKLAAEGQFSRNILPTEEKFYLGGPHFDRGFYYGEVTGDSALALTAEPLLDVKFLSLESLPAWIGPLPLSAQFYGFYDWGQAWQNQSTDANITLRSVGGGVRFYVGQRVEMDVEGVSRLTRSPDGSPPAVSRLKSSAIYWQILGRF
jgi:hemolysin activation/secretion protein